MGQCMARALTRIQLCLSLSIKAISDFASLHFCIELSMMELNPLKLTYAAWALFSLVFVYTCLRIAILFIATTRRRNWHLQLHRIRKRHHAAGTKTADPSAPSADLATSSSIPLVPLVKRNDTDESVQFMRPSVGWRSAYVAAQEERTGLRELFL